MNLPVKGAKGNTSRGSSFGFTLIEVLVAMSLMAFMSFMMYSTISTSRTAQRLSEQRADQTQAAAAAMDMLVQDINMAYLSLGEDMNEQNRRTFFKAVPDFAGVELIFSTMSHKPTRKNAHESEACVVRYTLQRDMEVKGLYALVRRESRRLGHVDPLEIPAEIRTIVGQVASMEVMFFDALKDEWTDTWDTTSIDGQSQRLPQMVRIHLAVDLGTGSLVHFHTMARPHIMEPLNLLPATGKVTPFTTTPSGSGTNSPSPVDPNANRGRQITNPIDIPRVR